MPHESKFALWKATRDQKSDGGEHVRSEVKCRSFKSTSLSPNRLFCNRCSR